MPPSVARPGVGACKCRALQSPVSGPMSDFHCFAWLYVQVLEIYVKTIIGKLIYTDRAGESIKINKAQNLPFSHNFPGSVYVTTTRSLRQERVRTRTRTWYHLTLSYSYIDKVFAKKRFCSRGNAGELEISHSFGLRSQILGLSHQCLRRSYWKWEI